MNALDEKKAGWETNVASSVSCRIKYGRWRRSECAGQCRRWHEEMTSMFSQPRRRTTGPSHPGPPHLNKRPQSTNLLRPTSESDLTRGTTCCPESRTNSWILRGAESRR